MSDWSMKRKKQTAIWPKDDNGEMATPAFLTHLSGGAFNIELTLNLLEAYSIPYVCEYPNNGLFGKLLVGYPPTGVEVYVPETLLEDARNIMSADICEEEEV